MGANPYAAGISHHPKSNQKMRVATSAAMRYAKPNPIAIANPLFTHLAKSVILSLSHYRRRPVLPCARPIRRLLSFFIQPLARFTCCKPISVYRSRFSLLHGGQSKVRFS